LDLSAPSLNPISSRYGLRVPGRCFVPHVVGRFEEHHVELEEERFNEVGKWEWIPSSGRPLRVWDVKEFLGRLVNSPRGLIFIGGEFSLSATILKNLKQAEEEKKSSKES